MSEEENLAADELLELDDPGTLDLSARGLTKLNRAAFGHELSTMTLLLDNNSLQRLDNIHTYQCLEKLSVCNNELIRMSQVAKLNHLKILNLSNNNIEIMDGLKELKLLTWLGLANNKIKSIQVLNQCVHLEHLDLSGNFVQHLCDLSYLKNLKVLLLHRNNIETLRGCERFFPKSLTTLTLNGNDLTDLTEVSFLTGLRVMDQLTVADNPCILQPEDETKQFDYRPYVINWCLALRVLDGIIIGAKESLKAEWLYSQSKGRHFNVGQHEDLVAFLLSVCPLRPGEEWEEDKKLNLILSKVQEHQLSLREPGSGMNSPRSSTLPRASPSSKNSTPVASVRGSASTTPVAARRSSCTPVKSIPRRSSLSRASPSPVRRGVALSKMSAPLSYALSLPRTLYGDDINGNGTLMTQSMDPAHLATKLDNSSVPSVLSENVGRDHMTTSLDSTLLMKKEAWTINSSQQQPLAAARPSTLFGNHDPKELHLQEISDGEQSHSLGFSKLHSRLNPVPESLNSPDDFKMDKLKVPSPPPHASSLVKKADNINCIDNVDVYSTSSDEQSRLGGGNGTQNKVDKAQSSELRWPFKPKPAPTKILGQRPAVTKGVKQQSRLGKRASPEVDRKLMKASDTTRLSRNRTDEDESSHSEASGVDQKYRIRKTRRARANSMSRDGRKYAPDKYSDEARNQRPASASTTPRQRARTVDSSSCTTPRKAAPPKAAASTTIQKNWRGHAAKEKDAERVNHLKEEIRSLRTEEHIKRLSKELACAKQALERERKLRVLQMDAIKVLWKEVQLMDEANVDPDCIRPSGRGGSKISSRSSEHSIAKLMETLQSVTPAPMAQSMPPTILEGQLNDGSHVAVETLSQTCSNLQGQVEQLQSSIGAMMQLMTSLHGASQDSENSSADTFSFNYFQPLTQSVGPMSLPVVCYPPPHGCLEGLAMSKSCDCLAQTEVAAATPRNEQMPPNPGAQLVHFAKPPDSSPEESEGLRPQHSGRMAEKRQQPQRSRSPRPQTLPGLVNAGKTKCDTKNSTQASRNVKAFASNLIDELILETISMANSKGDSKSEAVAIEDADKANDETDVSLSLATEDQDRFLDESLKIGNSVKSPSTSQVETDSLDESDCVGQPSQL